MNCGIYKITNTVNGKVYIGSSVRIKRRLYEHFRILKNNGHTNSHLQRAWNKCGKNSFIFEVLLYCDEENLLFYEQKIMSEYKSLDGKFGYNICQARRNNLTGSNAIERNKKISESNKGKHLSKETIKKISESKKGLHKGKNNPMFGKNRSEETRNRISKTRIKNKVAKGENNPNYGKIRSKKTRHRISKNSVNVKSLIANNKYYRSITEASQDLQINRWIITYRIKTNKSGYFWK